MVESGVRPERVSKSQKKYSIYRRSGMAVESELRRLSSLATSGNWASDSEGGLYKWRVTPEGTVSRTTVSLVSGYQCVNSSVPFHPQNTFEPRLCTQTLTHHHPEALPSFPGHGKGWPSQPLPCSDAQVTGLPTQPPACVSLVEGLSSQPTVAQPNFPTDPNAVQRPLTSLPTQLLSSPKEDLDIAVDLVEGLPSGRQVTSPKVTLGSGPTPDPVFPVLAPPSGLHTHNDTCTSKGPVVNSDSPELVTIYGPGGCTELRGELVTSEINCEGEVMPCEVLKGISSCWERDPTVRQPTRPIRPGVPPKFKVTQAQDSVTSDKLRQDLCPELQAVLDEALSGSFKGDEAWEAELGLWDLDDAFGW